MSRYDDYDDFYRRPVRTYGYQPEAEPIKECCVCGGATEARTTKRETLHICLQRRGPCGVRVRVLKDQYDARVNRIVMVQTRTTPDLGQASQSTYSHFESQSRYEVISVNGERIKLTPNDVIRQSLAAGHGDKRSQFAADDVLRRSGLRAGTEITVEDANGNPRRVQFV